MDLETLFLIMLCFLCIFGIINAFARFIAEIAINNHYARQREKNWEIIEAKIEIIREFHKNKKPDEPTGYLSKNEISEAIRSIGLALNASHNTVTTDDAKTEPVADYSWRIDNSKEIELLDKLESLLLNGSEI